MLIYNLAQYIIAGTSIDIIINGWFDGDSGVMISDSGGNSAHSHDRKELRYQIISRNEDKTTSYLQANTISNYLDNRFGVVLPAANFDGTVYSAVQTSQISVMTTPQYLGTDDNGKHEFSTNIIVITN